jgi:hypothetical protein
MTTTFRPFEPVLDRQTVLRNLIKSCAELLRESKQRTGFGNAYQQTAMLAAYDELTALVALDNANWFYNRAAASREAAKTETGKYPAKWDLQNADHFEAHAAEYSAQYELLTAMNEAKRLIEFC